MQAICSPVQRLRTPVTVQLGLVFDGRHVIASGILLGLRTIVVASQTICFAFQKMLRVSAQARAAAS